MALLEADRLDEADRELTAAYQRRPQDPVLVETARRMAAETVPQW